jgi:chromosome segregation ATPase
VVVYSSRELAAEGVDAAARERDTIQANLLELDNSFGKRMLAGATLAGESRQRWDVAAAALAALWETFTAYSAVVDKAAELLASSRRPSPARLIEISSLLNTASSVRLTQAVQPLARRDLTGSGVVTVTVTAAVQEMKKAFAIITDVVSAAETVWNEAADRLQQASAALAGARRQTDGITDEALGQALGQAETHLARLRDQLNSDPLALWRRGHVDVTELDRLREETTAATAMAARLAALRDDADRRIATVAAAVTTARAAYQDALAAREQVRAKIAAAVPAPPPVAALAGRLDGLDAIKSAGRWGRLASELEAVQQQAAAAAKSCRDAQAEALALLERRNELRGLLDAYRARAGKIGAAEDTELDVLERRAREVLWSAPCDLAAAADAVTSYQQAVITISRQAQRP